MKVVRDPVSAAVLAAYALAFACVLAGCDEAGLEAHAATPSSAPVASQATPRYFGEEFGEAQKALADKPIEAPAPTF